MRNDNTVSLRVWSAWLCLALCLGTLLVPAAARAQTVTVDSTAVTTGMILTVDVSGFGRDEILFSWVSSARGSVFATSGGVTDRNGRATLRIPVKRFWESGWWAVTVRGDRSERLVTATFEVMPAPPSGRLDIEPAQARPGQSVRFSGTGFAVGERLSVWATRPDGSTLAVGKDLRAGAGAIYDTFDLPANAPPGSWYLTAYGTDSDRLLVGSFTVAP